MLRSGKLLTPPVKQFDPVIEALPPVVGAGDFVVVNMIQSKFHHVTRKAIIARQS